MFTTSRASCLKAAKDRFEQYNLLQRTMGILIEIDYIDLKHSTSWTVFVNYERSKVVMRRAQNAPEVKFRLDDAKLNPCFKLITALRQCMIRSFRRSINEKQTASNWNCCEHPIIQCMLYPYGLELHVPLHEPRGALYLCALYQHYPTILTSLV